VDLSVTGGVKLCLGAYDFGAGLTTLRHRHTTLAAKLTSVFLLWKITQIGVASRAEISMDRLKGALFHLGITEDATCAEKTPP
jgi:hypothetical protein